MPRVRKQKTVREMRVELEALQKEIENREREEKLAGLANARDFKAVAREIARLNLTNQQIVELFAKAPAAAPAVRRRVAKPAPQIKVKPKYRNPANAEQTWTGRGKRPRWVEEAIAQGTSLEELLIKD